MIAAGKEGRVAKEDKADLRQVLEDCCSRPQAHSSGLGWSRTLNPKTLNPKP